jgi:hypothetical protein
MGPVIPWPNAGADGLVTEERKRFSIAKAVLAEISLK